jgi:hypothetical protein
MLPLVIGVAALAGGVAYRQHKKKTAMSPQQKMILETALNSKLTTDDYLKLAAAFDAEGLKAEGAVLKARASLQNASKEQKLAYRNAFKLALSSEDPKLVLKMADAFAGKGAVGAAADLKKYAQGLKDGTATPSPAPTVTTGTGGPSIVSVPPAIIATPPATPTVNLQTTATPTVSQSTGAVVTPGNTSDPNNQGAPAAGIAVGSIVVPPQAAVQSVSNAIPSIVSAGLAVAAGAPAPTIAIPGASVQSTSTVPQKLADAAQGAALQAQLDAAVGATIPNVTGSVAASGDMMNQGVPKQ